MKKLPRLLIWRGGRNLFRSLSFFQGKFAFPLLPFSYPGNFPIFLAEQETAFFIVSPSLFVGKKGFHQVNYAR